MAQTAETPKSKPDASQKTITFIAILWLVTIPFGVAVHNLANFIALIVLTTFILKHKPTEGLSQISTSIKIAWSFLALFMTCSVIGGLLNVEFDNKLTSFIAGRLSILLFPIALLVIRPRINIFDSSKFKTVFIWILTIWGAIFVSQFFYPWGIRGTGIVNYGNRPEGFYSNALTAAYVLFLFYPFLLAKFLTTRNRYWSLAFFAIAVALLVNNSRMILAVCLIITATSVLYFTRGRLKIGLIIAGVLITSVTLVTDNPVSNRINTLLAQGENITYKGYKDHRLVFWDVYTDIIRERPFFGHGPKLSSEYHVPYYDARGFEDFEKKYSAHNQYLQAAGNSGLIGLSFFILWIFMCYKIIHESNSDRLIKLVFFQTLTGFLIAGLSQNAFQDAEVRQALMLFFIIVISFRGHNLNLRHPENEALK